MKMLLQWKRAFAAGLVLFSLGFVLVKPACAAPNAASQRTVTVSQTDGDGQETHG